jgi:hypothetical protein
MIQSLVRQTRTPARSARSTASNVPSDENASEVMSSGNSVSLRSSLPELVSNKYTLLKPLHSYPVDPPTAAISPEGDSAPA